MWFSIPRSLMKLLTLLAIFGLGVGPASAHSCVPEYLTQVGTRALTHAFAGSVILALIHSTVRPQVRQTPAEILVDAGTLAIASACENPVASLGALIVGRNLFALCKRFGYAAQTSLSSLAMNEEQQAKLVVLVKNLQAGVECESLNACLEEAANWRKLGFAAEAGRSVRRGIGFSPTAQLVMEHAKEGNLRATIQALLQLIREPLDAPSLGELALYARAVARSHSSSVEQEASWISIVNCSGREDPHACLELLVAE